MSKNYYIAPLVTAFFALGFVVMYSFGMFDIAGASTIVGNDYKAKYVSSATASTTSVTTLKTGQGSLGSVVITVPSNATAYPHLTIYNSTSTMATTSAPVLAQFGTTTGETVGTYQFDVEFTNGLSIEVPSGFTGKYTVTYR